ncbi:hypothetical protein HU755_19275 [Pseudomonas sp. SWRI111]|uniref:Uncharacterized protein n=1 Tax=Pseudomonas hamedanensis TaxID=2745504 RepID=A0A9E6P0I5_9PSED|nr:MULTISPECIES: hypothetical protein [Pseudomonas]MBC3208949.1 hypothetical protein [Pseudomonas sp. SWRI111]QXI17822.1 hypothetical protein HU739_002160 [Pseudomonas hamedanensis]
MSDQLKEALLAAWRKRAGQTEADVDPEDQYDELLKAADQMEEQGLITSAEWRQLVREAGNLFTLNEQQPHR